MGTLLDDLADLRSRIAGVVVRATQGGEVHAAADDQLVEVLVRAADAHRALEAVLVEGVGEIAARSRSMVRDERLTTRMGCRSVNELVQRLTRASPQSAGRLEQAQRATAPVWDPITGAERPAALPAMRQVLLDGEAGVDGVIAVAGPLLAAGERAGREKVLAADAVLAAEARGEGPDAAPPACAELLRVQAQVWAAVLDQDGAAPREDDAEHHREITIGRARGGLVPIRGRLLPEVAAQFRRICDAINSPYTDGPRGVRFTVGGEVRGEEPDPAWLDTRSPAHKRHDALATALFTAAASGELPTIGGAAPTLVISARAEDLAKGVGWAFLEGCDEPVSIWAARRAACAGVLQRVVHRADGRIVAIGTEERVFNRHQRRAIALRDGGCIIPGCGIPAGWCEIHHVTDHAKGGPTHTDNGVLLCWFHHRFIDKGPWQVRMNGGAPEVRAPRWFDHDRRWRAVTTSPPACSAR